MDVDAAAPLPSAADPVVDNAPTSPSPSQQPTSDTSTPLRLTKSGRPSKVKPIVPGSAADFRRRESNRLAAERSRFRQQDKVVGLENAAKTLNEENLRLRLQIAQLEGHSNPEDVHAVHIPLDNADSSVSVAVTPTAATSTPADQTQEQQEHSHTILAALTDITGVDFASEGSNWMQGMENFLKDSDASGRLGDLAAVATGHDEGAGAGHGQTTANEAFTQSETEESRNTGSNLTRDAVGANAPSSPSATTKSVRPQAPTPTASAVVVMAAAINTEMERLIMEDLAETKAAIVTLENQLNRLREGLDPGESQYAENVALLPTSIFSEDPDELHATTSNLQSRISQLEEELPGQREELVNLRDATTDEQEKLVAVVHELQKLAEEMGEEQKGKITEFLVEAGGFVKNLLDKQREQAEISSRDLPPGATFSPAIARRRRGRPPKSSLARSFYQSFLLAPAEVEKGEPTEIKTKGKKRPRKSRLSQKAEGVAEGKGSSGATHTIGTREREAASATPIVEASTSHNVEDGPEVAEAERIAALEAVDQAKAFLTSHMTSGNTEPDHMDVGLDSTSFADLLPAQAALASQDQVDEALASATREMNSQSQRIDVGMEGEGDGEGEEEQSVLSRLRRGPPGSCDICSRTETTVWRKLTFGQTDLKVCNACGQYHSKFGVIRPFQLWGDGRQVRKRRSTQRLSSGGESDQLEGISSSASASASASGDAEGGPKKKQKIIKGKSINPSPLTMEHSSLEIGMEDGMEMEMELKEGQDFDEEVEQVEVGVEDFMSPALQREVQHLHDQQQSLEVDSGLHDHGDVMARVLAGMGV